MTVAELRALISSLPDYAYVAWRDKNFGGPLEPVQPTQIEFIPEKSLVLFDAPWQDDIEA